MSVVVFVLAMVLGFSGTNQAFGEYLSDSFDVGYIHGGYSTSSYPDYYGKGTYAQLSANIGGQHRINDATVTINPNYWYTFDNNGDVISRVLHGYIVSAWMYGEISAPLTVVDIGSHGQSNNFNANRISFAENTWINTYQDDNGELFSNANVYASVLNFDVQSANGYYSEYTMGDGGIGGGGMGIKAANAADGPGDSDAHTYFNYNVTWYGNFVPVPEPGTIAMIVSVILGLPFVAGGNILRKGFLLLWPR